MNPRSLSSHQRSPFARRVLAYIRAQDPLISEGEVARRIGVSGQVFSTWMLSKNKPSAKNIARLAEVLGCSEDDIKRDLELSKHWVPPTALDQFAQEVMKAARKENWPNRDWIIRQMEQSHALLSRGSDSVWAIMVQDVLSLRLPLQEKAKRLDFLVSAWERLRDDPDLY